MRTRLRARVGSPWAVLLAGPIVGTAYFFLVYLLAEASCADDVDLLGTAALRVVIVGAAVASVAVFAVYAVRARQLWSEGGDGTERDDQNDRFMVTAGLLLLGLFVLFVLFLAAPAIGTTLC